RPVASIRRRGCVGASERALEQFVERFEHYISAAAAKSAAKQSFTASSSARNWPWKKWPTPSSTTSSGGAGNALAHSITGAAGTTSSAAPCTSSQRQRGAANGSGIRSMGGATVTRPLGSTAAATPSATAAPNENRPK